MARIQRGTDSQVELTAAQTAGNIHLPITTGVGGAMRGKKLGIALAVLTLVAAGAGAQPGRSDDPADALSGTVTSAGAPMEGVVVTVRQSGSTIATSVVSDAQGRYRFPRGRLAPGDYAVSIKAAGFDLDKPAPIRIAASEQTTADL